MACALRGLRVEGQAFRRRAKGDRGLYLKKLELYGFKSFADKTELEFEPGITAVVGPNGSGKSNISDAIRWVLGEQSARILRGSKMQDVIFSGTDKRKPLGYAEVTLTLDNSDGSLPLDFGEVTITRRVFRSGEGEYYINKAPCRLKDVFELFMDTGVGKEAYSIIEQGKIDVILSARSEDRRAVFEEAAGIVKYKTRKREALQKLEDTRYNLVRVSDILSELERQMGPLSRQAELAKQYLDIESRLAKLETSLLAWDLKRLVRTREEHEAALKAAQGEHASKEAAIGAMEAQAEALKGRMAQASKAVDEARSLLGKLMADRQAKGAELSILLERVEGARVQRASIVADIGSLDEKLEALDERLRKTSAELAKAEAELAKVQRRTAERESEARGAQDKLLADRARYEEIKAEVIEALNRASAVKSAMADARAGVQAAERTLARLRDAKEARKSALDLALAELNRLEQERESVDMRRAGCRARLSEFSERRAALAKMIRETSDRLAKGALAQENARSRLKLLSDLEKAMEGYGEGTKAVLAAAKAGKLSGIRGVIGDLVTVPAGLETAMEVALGAAVGDVVTETEDDAKAAVEYLKRTGAGRATFLPLRMLRPRTLTQEERGILSSLRVVGVASEVLGHDPALRPAVEFLLGRTVITRNMDEALAAAKALDARARVVTLDGDVVNPGGAITGGSRPSQRSGVFARKREMEDLAKELDALAASSAALAAKLEELEAEDQGLLAESQELARELEALDISAVRLDAERKGLLEKREAAVRELEGIEYEESVQLTGIEELSHKLDELAAELAAAEQERTRLEEEAAVLRQSIQLCEEALSQAQSEVTRVRVDLASLEERRASLLREQKDLEAQSAGLMAQREARQKELSELDRRTGEWQAAIEELREKLAELESQVQEASARLSELTRAEGELAAELSELEAGLKAARRASEQASSRERSIELSLERAKMHAEQVASRLKELYGLSVQEALAMDVTVSDRDALSAEVEQTRERLRALGPVNIGAIQEYDILKERYDFLRAQHDDLVEARDSLSKVIEEIERTSKEQFVKTFEAIRAEFSGVFETLFGGGKADLVLADPENPLESGIEIVAQPPGKRLTSLMLLSGGEKSLTAVALLFAVLKVKPTPFCVLDEIDAALDEANVARFSELLQAMSEKVQFIVVTHRRRTMEVADAIYGVTMEESGISKLVSIKLERERSA